MLYNLLGFAVRLMRPTRIAILLKFETLRIVFLVLFGRIIAALTGRASQRDHDPILFTFACHIILRSSWLSRPRLGRYDQGIMNKAPTSFPSDLP